MAYCKYFTQSYIHRAINTMQFSDVWTSFHAFQLWKEHINKCQSSCEGNFGETNWKSKVRQLDVREISKSAKGPADKSAVGTTLAE